MKPTVESKEAYLVFVGWWKRTYKELSLNIREKRRHDRMIESVTAKGKKLDLDDCLIVDANSNRSFGKIRAEADIAHAWHLAIVGCVEEVPRIDQFSTRRQVARFMLGLRRHWKKESAMAREAALALIRAKEQEKTAA